MARSSSAVLNRVRRMCLELPDTKETRTWGKPHFRVGEKIFAGFDDGEHSGAVVSFKLDMQHAAAVIKEPHFTRAPYVGHKGWVSMDASRVDDWAVVRGLILESYRLIAPKRSLAKLEGDAEPNSAAMSPDRMTAAVVRNMKKRTGKDLEQWVRLARRSGLSDAKALRQWLKAAHGLGGTTCTVVSDAALGAAPAATPAEWLDAQFKGDRVALRPAYDRLVEAARALGTDVAIGVRKTQTTFSRGHTFAIAKVPTLKRIDLGLRLPGRTPTQRLKSTTAFSDNATHCVALTAVDDVDDQLIQWLAEAYAARG